MTNSARILFVGLGSPHGDDQIGWRIADELQPQVAELRAVTVRKAIVPLDLIDWLEGVDQLLICDACCTGKQIGTVLRLECSASVDNQLRLRAMDDLRSAGTHGFGVTAVLDLASRIVGLPATVVIHAIAGCQFDPGAAMSDELADAVPKIARTILEELTDARNVARAVAAASG